MFVCLCVCVFVCFILQHVLSLVYFIGCFNDNFGQMCAGCKQMISATDLWVEAQGQNYHPGCFRCEVRQRKSIVRRCDC